MNKIGKKMWHKVNKEKERRDCRRTPFGQTMRTNVILTMQTFPYKITIYTQYIFAITMPEI